MTHKPFSQSCENNKDPILQVISSVFCQPTTVWEIGSGTGQHACYFAEHLPHIEWQPTDRAENIPGIGLWQKDAHNTQPETAINAGCHRRRVAMQRYRRTNLPPIRCTS
jgi:hypothetical protein